MNTQQLTRPAADGGVYVIDIQEVPGGGYSYRPTHYGRLQDHEIFATPDAAADAAAVIWAKKTAIETGPMTAERYAALCAELGVEPKTVFSYGDRWSNYSVYEHGERAVEGRLHQLRRAQIKTETASDSA